MAGAGSYARHRVLRVPSDTVDVSLAAVPDLLIVKGTFPHHQRSKIVGEDGSSACATITQPILIGITAPSEINILIVPHSLPRKSLIERRVKG